MGQKKLLRFAEIKTFRNVLEYPAGMKGKLHSFFNNQNPIVLELACGKGEYTVELAGINPNKNFIGVDIKGNRIWAGAKRALIENLNNAAFIRSQIDKITDYFVPNEIDEIWITFPDPQLRLSRVRKRLTHPKFLRLFKQILKPDGFIHLKTDSPDLYGFTKTVIDLYDLRLITDFGDVYAQSDISPELNIKTYYENLDIAQSNKVHYLKFILQTEMPEEKDAQLKEILKNEQPG